jgi:hydrogenase-4 component B
VTPVQALLALAPVAPLLAALAAAAAPLRAARWALVAAAAPALAAGLFAAGSSLALPGLLLGAQLRLDAAFGAALGAVALVWLLAALHGVGGDEADAPRARRYLFCFALAMAGQMGAFLAADLATFFAAFATLSFAGYGLVAHKESAGALRAARIYVVFVVLGEMALLTAFLLIAAQTGGLAPPALSGVAPPAAAWWLLAVGFGVKAGLVPLHPWLPLAHPVAPVPASAALSGATLKAGLWGLLMFAPPTLPAPAGYGAALLGLGLLGGFGGALLAALQRDAKTALAWSSVSQMGLALGLFGAAAAGLAAPEAAATAIGLVILHHALAKAALFLGVESGLPRRVTLALLGVAALSLTGAPFTLGYAAKAAFEAAIGDPTLTTLFSAAAFATALAMARALRLIAARPPSTADPAKAAALLIAVGALAAAPVALDAEFGGFGLKAAAPALLLVALLGVAAVSRAPADGAAPGWAVADPMRPLAWAASLGGAILRIVASAPERVEALAGAALARFGAALGPLLAPREEPDERGYWVSAALGIGIVGAGILVALV